MITLTTSKVSTRPNRRWLLGDDRHLKQSSGYVNPGTEDGRIGLLKSGTILGRVTADNTLKPLGLAYVPTGAASATQELEDASMFRVGDTLQCYEDDGTTTIGDTVTIVSIDGNEIVMSASRTTLDGSIIRRTDGSAVPVGILSQDCNTLKSHDEHGLPIYGKEGVVFYRSAWIDWDYVLCKSDEAATLLQALGFTIDNQ